MKIAIGCDDAALNFKNTIRDYLRDQGHEVIDCGIENDKEHTLYPDIANCVAKKVVDGDVERGILVCGTGLGMCITANKVKGIIAAVCHDPFSTERSIKSNNANIMCMGARVIGMELGKMLVDIWLNARFTGGLSLPKYERIREIEALNFR